MSIKLWIVFDVLFKVISNSLSLNDCLCLGLVLILIIFKILFWFRERKIVLVVDIEKVFLNIGVYEEDCDVL